MRLRKQLFIASLFTLSLPWVGCQYIQEMESALLQGQNEALSATARAVSSTIENDENLLGELNRFTVPNGSQAIYLFPFNAPLTLDGYNEEWQSQSLKSQSLFSENTISTDEMHIIGAQYLQQSWLFLSIPDSAIRYYNPSAPIAHADHIVLSTQKDDGEMIEYTLAASSPGLAQVGVISANEFNIQHDIKAIWRETENGYQVELNLASHDIKNGLAINVFNGDPEKPTLLFSNVNQRLKHATLPPVTRLSERLNKALSIFNRDGVSLKLASTGAALVANTGELARSNTETTAPPWLAFIYGLILNNTHYSKLPQPEKLGHFASEDIINPLLGKQIHKHYSLRGQTISTVSIPIQTSDGIAGVLVAQQNANSLSAFTNTAFNRLLMYSMIVVLGSALTLVMYASWLSIRISRLSRLTSSAISDTGKIIDNFRTSKLNDELGDLSRSFGQLHSRLKEYTHYLKTLSSKLSHELRTPLAIVSSSLDNLEHEALSEQAATYAKRAKEGTTRLSSILNSMSAASRVEQAIGSAELTTVPLDELLTNLNEAYSDVYHHVSFSTKIQPNTSGYNLLGAGELLVQMLDKLVDNAADYCPKGGQIEFGLSRQQHDLVITVRNEGPVLPHTMHKQLFDSMVSVRDRHTDNSRHHLGLGLYIVRLIVDFHQGHVECYNVADNSGVIFEIRLPV